ncbi:hypothetical protein EMIT0158MI4_20086 [Burkholderia ambifaria]
MLHIESDEVFPGPQIKSISLIFIGYFIRTGFSNSHTRSIPLTFKYITFECIKTRSINHLLTFQTPNFSLFVNLQISPQINSAHQF